MSTISQNLISPKMIRRLCEEISALGSAVGSGCVALLLLAFRPRLGWLVAAGLIFATTIGIMIKSLWRTRRPDHQEIGTQHQPLADAVDASSFPSVHALRVAALGTIVWGALGSIERVVLILLTLAVIVSRVALGRHRWIDVVGGSVLGVIVGLSVLYLF